MTAKKRGNRKVNGAIVNAVVVRSAKGEKPREILADIKGISESTVHKIRKSKSELIEAKKEQYIKIIDKHTGGDEKQAQVLAEALEAEIPVYSAKGEYMGSKPDTRARLDAIKYIDQLKGRHAGNARLTQNNTIISKDLDKWVR